MKVKPLREYRTPAYPNKSTVLRNPNILKSMPQRWKGNVKVGFAMSSAFLLLMTGCGNKPGGSDVNSTTNSENVSTSEGINILTVPNAEHELVSPIFEHGSGRGSFGCVSVAPPAFFSEAEAFEIINEEAGREGIVFDSEPIQFENIEIPITYLFLRSENGSQIDLRTNKDTLELDGYDIEKRIAVEFVSKNDVVAWQEKNPGVWSSVESYDTLGAAKKLQEGLMDKTDGNITAVFYDPMGFDEEIYDAYNEESRKISDNAKLSDEQKDAQWTQLRQKYKDNVKESKTAMLREQVKDFLNWLKAQAII